MSEQTELVLQKGEIERRINALGLHESDTLSLKERFLPFVIQAQEWRDQADKIVVADEDDTKAMKLAREIRLALKQIRVSLEKERKALKKESLQKGQSIDTIAGMLRGLIEPIEADLQLKEDYRHLVLERRKDELRDRRMQELEPFKLEHVPHDLRLLSEDEYLNYFARVKFDFEEAIKNAAENERIRLAEVERQKEVQRKKALAADRASMMMKSGYQYDGVDLGEIFLDEFTALLDTRKAEKEEKLRLTEVKFGIEKWYDQAVARVNNSDLSSRERIRDEIVADPPADYHLHKDYFNERLAMLDVMYNKRTKEIEEAEQLKQEKTELVVENIELKVQVEEIKIEKAEAPVIISAVLDKNIVETSVRKNPMASSTTTLKPESPLNPPIVAPVLKTPEQIASDKLKLLTLAGMIAGIQMPAMETDGGIAAVKGTENLIEKIRIYLVEKSKTII